MQKVAYNGGKSKHALKYQAITSSDGLVLHAAEPIERERHDCTLFCQSGVDESLPRVKFVGGKRHCIYGDSGYNQFPFLEVPYQVSNLSAPQRSFKGPTLKGRVTVEWYLKEFKLYWSNIDYKRKMRTG